MAGFTAIQALREKACVKDGQSVLIVGASGGVGTFAVQIARAFGASVTGVCSTGNLELVRSIGANRLVDYTKEDFSSSVESYDVIVQTAGNYSLKQLRKVLATDGTLVVAGDSSGVKAVFGMSFIFRIINSLVITRFSNQQVPPFLAKSSKQDLVTLSRLIESTEVKPVIDRTYSMEQVAEAVAYLEAGHARGKVVITI
jgi:NADPH:quinone reductase-like Zn-dependent oxidoreductase